MLSSADTTLLLIALVLLLASFLQAYIGFGMGMFAAPFILFLDPTLVPTSLVFLSIGVSLALVIAERRTLDFRGASVALIGRVPGSILGGIVVWLVNPNILALIVAGVIIFGVLVSIGGWRPRVNTASLMTAGFFSGLAGTATSIGGTPMVIIWQGKKDEDFRGAMSAFFLVGSIISLVVLVAMGSYDPASVTTTLLMIPVVFLGFLGSRVFIKYNKHKNVIAVFALWASLAGALLLVVKTVAGVVV